MYCLAIVVFHQKTVCKLKYGVIGKPCRLVCRCVSLRRRCEGNVAFLPISSTMYLGIHTLALLHIVFLATLEQLEPRKRGNSVVRSKNGSEVLCSEAGNCTCLFEEHSVTVKCTSAGDNLDKVAPELPKTTTQL